MLISGHRKDNCTAAILLFILLFYIMILTGCNSSGGEEESAEDPPETSQTADPEQWIMHRIKHLDAEGLLIPQVSAKQGSDGNIRIAYFSDGTDFGTENRYDINYLVWDPEADEILSEEILNPQPPDSGGVGLDNCNPLSLVLDNLDHPIIAYQGGFYRDQGPSDGEQSDIMFSIRGEQGWTEYMGAMGYVTRNPFYDGLAGSDLSAAVDSEGDVHIGYQFYYEGMDSYNFNYPDLDYVKREAYSLDNTVSDSDWANIEETVYGSTITQTSAVHRGTGYNCRLLLDSSDSPVVFFSESTDYSSTYGLWFARRNSNGDWDRQWVEQVNSGWAIGDISAAMAPNGTLAVAYTKICLSCDHDEGDHLKYAVQSGNTWDVQVVDESSICGHNPSLAFDSQGNPAIAYYDRQSHSGHNRRYLKFVQRNGAVWSSETVIEDYDFGHHNSLWFDAGDKPFISSYSETADDIAVFEKQ